jgi:hypothetical protein
MIAIEYKITRPCAMCEPRDTPVRPRQSSLVLSQPRAYVLYPKLGCVADVTAPLGKQCWKGFFAPLFVAPTSGIDGLDRQARNRQGMGNRLRTWRPCHTPVTQPALPRGIRHCNAPRRKVDGPHELCRSPTATSQSWRIPASLVAKFCRRSAGESWALPAATTTR